MTSIQTGVNNTVTSATTQNTTTSSSSSSSSSTTAGGPSIADNFQTFLKLLTTQLQNQDPTSPLDTNQFTQQLVEFAGVQQQLQANSQLTTLVSLQQSAQSTQALSFVGDTVTVNGSSAQLTNGQTTWSLSSPKPASATLTVTNASGQTVFTGNTTLQSGLNTFNWNGQGNNGTQWPDGTYTMSVKAQDAAGQAVTVATQVTGVVNSVDLTQNPPTLSINGQNFTISQVTGVSKS